MLYGVFEKKSGYCVLDDIKSKEEAERLMSDLYGQDKKDGCYTPCCYKVGKIR